MTGTYQHRLGPGRARLERNVALLAPTGNRVGPASGGAKGLTRRASSGYWVQEHWSILEALGRRDPDASEAAMRLHIRRSTERLAREADHEAVGAT